MAEVLKDPMQDLKQEYIKELAKRAERDFMLLQELRGKNREPVKEVARKVAEEFFAEKYPHFR